MALSLNPQILPPRTYLPFENSHCTEQIFIFYLELDVCQKPQTLRKQVRKGLWEPGFNKLRSYTFLVLRGDKWSAKACRQSIEHAHRGTKGGLRMRGGLDKVPTAGTFIDTTYAWGKHKVIIDPAHRVIKHVRTPI